MWLAPRLKHRLQIGTATMTPNMTTGGMDFSFTALVTVWAEVKQASEYIRAIRGQQTQGGETHKFTVRRESVRYLGKSFSAGYSSAFDIEPDSNSVKSEWFCMIEEGSTVKGRLFRVVGIERHEVGNEYLVISANEMEERGTGWPE